MLATLQASQSRLSEATFYRWKQIYGGMWPSTFSGAGDAAKAVSESEVDKLHAKIGRLVVERDFFSESLRSMSVDRRRAMVEPAHHCLSISAQCRLLRISRSSYYYAPVPETDETLALMTVIDETFMECPWSGSRQMARHLRRNGRDIGRRRARRLMAKMGLTPIYQRPRTSDPHPQHRVYRYLLRKLAIERPNHVWCADVTYIPLSLAPDRRQEIVRWLQDQFRVSERRGCKTLGFHRRPHRYKSIRDEQVPLRKRIREIAETRIRYGYRRIRELLRPEDG